MPRCRKSHMIRFPVAHSAPWAEKWTTHTSPSPRVGSAQSTHRVITGPHVARSICPCLPPASTRLAVETAGPCRKVASQRGTRPSARSLRPSALQQLRLQRRPNGTREPWQSMPPGRRESGERTDRHDGDCRWATEHTGAGRAGRRSPPGQARPGDGLHREQFAPGAPARGARSRGAYEPVSFCASLQNGDRGVSASLRGAPTDRRRGRHAYRFDVLDRLDRAGSGVQDSESVCDDLPAHDRPHADRVPSRSSARRLQGRHGPRRLRRD